jgi:hypothetical protein
MYFHKGQNEEEKENSTKIDISVSNYLRQMKNPVMVRTYSTTYTQQSWGVENALYLMVIMVTQVVY